MSCTGFSFSVTAEHDGSDVRTFLRKACGITARSMTILKYGEGGIYRNGALLKAHDTVRTGDILTLRLPPEKNEIVPVKGELHILFEDEYLLVVDKPAHMPVHPTKSHQLDTLANIVADYQMRREESCVFRALNRLDKDTSGCVMLAKDRLSYALVKDSVKKTYIAVCEGRIEKDGTVDLPIGMAEGSKIIRAVDENGASAVTHYKPIKSTENHTVVQLWLETGRTHQIRCHMSAIGHPLAGDELYGGSRRFLDRQALHCDSVGLIHPFTKAEHCLHSALPDDMKNIINREDAY